MFYAIEIENPRLIITTSTTGQQYDALNTVRAMGLKAHCRMYPYKENRPSYDDYDDLKGFIERLVKQCSQ